MISKIITNFLIFLIRCYKIILAPLFPSGCRHEPSCSAYGIEALRMHGAIKGIQLIVKRLIRCHPAGSWGYDPVPVKCHCEPAEGAAKQSNNEIASSLRSSQ